MGKIEVSKNLIPLPPEYPSLMDLLDALHEERRGGPRKPGARSKMDDLLDRIETAKAQRPAYEEAKRRAKK